jgi:hypothetical protein
MRLLLSFLLFTFYFACTAQIPSYVPTNGLVGYWPFNGNANDESGNGNNGTVYGPTFASDRFGNVNKAYYFDGLNDSISFGDIHVLDFTNAFSVSVFFKYTVPPISPNDWYSIVADGSYADYNGWGILINSNQFLMRELDNTNGIVVNYNFIQNNWYHIGLTCGSDSIKLYINGIKIASTFNIQSNLTLNTSNSLRVGSGTMNNVPVNSHPYFFTGVIDDIYLYNRVINQSEITQLYTNTITTFTPEDTTSNVGIGTTTPKRKLHINDVMRLEPRDTAPANPAKGDIYFDGVLNKLRVYDGSVWQSCW